MLDVLLSFPPRRVAFVRAKVDKGKNSHPSSWCEPMFIAEGNQRILLSARRTSPTVPCRIVIRGSRRKVADDGQVVLGDDPVLQVVPARAVWVPTRAMRRAVSMSSSESKARRYSQPPSLTCADTTVVRATRWPPSGRG